MLIRLISLAILLLILNVNHIGLANEKFILPKDKPSVFKKIEKSKTEVRNPLPQSKPSIKTKEKLEVKDQKINEKNVLKKKRRKTDNKSRERVKNSQFYFASKET